MQNKNPNIQLASPLPPDPVEFGEVLAGPQELTPLMKHTIELLTESGEVGEYLVPTYLAAMDESPSVQHACVYSKDLKDDPSLRNAPGYHMQTETDDIVVVAASNGWKVYTQLFKKRAATVAVIAEKLGMPAKDMDEPLLASFILAHELGHVDDAASHAHGTYDLKTEEEVMTLPLPGMTPGSSISFLKTPKGILYWRKHKDDYASAGIRSRKELVVAQERAYRKISTEANADDFARRVMQRLRAAESKTDPV